MCRSPVALRKEDRAAPTIRFWSDTFPLEVSD